MTLWRELNNIRGMKKSKNYLIVPLSLDPRFKTLNFVSEGEKEKILADLKSEYELEKIAHKEIKPITGGPLMDDYVQKRMKISPEKHYEQIFGKIIISSETKEIDELYEYNKYPAINLFTISAESDKQKIFANPLEW